jgi:taurine transport system permease protein
MTKEELAVKKQTEMALLKRHKRNAFFLGVLGMAIFFAIWEMVYRFGIISSKLIVPPEEVARILIIKTTDKKPEGDILINHILASLSVALSGYAIAVLIGIPLGLFMGWYKPVDRIVGPVFEILRPIPPIAWIPFTIIFLGIGLRAKAIIIFLSAFIPCVINAYTGIKLTNQVYINVSKTCGAASWETFLRVGVPSSMPMIFAGMRISLGNAWSALVAAEMLAANRGLGYMILMGRTYGRVDLIMGGMIMIGLLGILFNLLFDKLENFVLRWRMTK